MEKDTFVEKQGERKGVSFLLLFLFIYLFIYFFAPVIFYGCFGFL